MSITVIGIVDRIVFANYRTRFGALIKPGKVKELLPHEYDRISQECILNEVRVSFGLQKGQALIKTHRFLREENYFIDLNDNYMERISSEELGLTLNDWQRNDFSVMRYSVSGAWYTSFVWIKAWQDH